MALRTHMRTTWVVLDTGERVVVLLQGADAPTAADDWVARGYRVEELADEEAGLHADVA